MWHSLKNIYMRSSLHKYQNNEDKFLFQFWFLPIFQTKRCCSLTASLCLLLKWNMLVSDLSIINKKSSILYWYFRWPLFNVYNISFGMFQLNAFFKESEVFLFNTFYLILFELFYLEEQSIIKPKIMTPRIQEEPRWVCTAENAAISNLLSSTW